MGLFSKIGIDHQLRFVGFIVDDVGRVCRLDLNQPPTAVGGIRVKLDQSCVGWI